MNATSEKPNPTEVPDPRAQAPQGGKSARPPSTIGEIVMAVFVGATAVIYIVLTCVSIETLHIDQRAWVGEKEIDTHLSPRSIDVDVTLINSGKTIARVTSSKLLIHFNHGAMDAESYWRAHEPSESGGKLVDLPNITFHSKGNIAPTVDDANSLQLGDGRLYVIGEVVYLDIFNTTHTTKYCAWSEKFKDDGAGGTIAEGPHGCPEHNEAD